jgi:hypothetical protein
MKKSTLFSLAILASALIAMPGAAWDGRCKEHEIHLGEDHGEADTIQVPAMDLGEAKQFFDRDGNEVVATCTREGVSLEIEGSIVAIYGDGVVRVPGEDGSSVVIREHGEHAQTIQIIDDDGEKASFRMEVGGEGHAWFWSSDEDGEFSATTTMTIESDEDGESISIHVDRDEVGDHRHDGDENFD